MTTWIAACIPPDRLEQHHGNLPMILADAEYLPRVAAEDAPDWLRYPGKWGNPDRGSDPGCFGSTGGPRGPVFGDVAILRNSTPGERWLYPWRWAEDMNEQIACPAGPGTADILWRNENTGQVVIWLLDGTQPIDAGSSGVAGPVWTIADLGDFNADGFQDILWRHDNGQAFIWLMNGTQRVGQGSPGSVGQPWQIAGVGDFDGDRRDDILWRHTVSGQVFIWFIDGTQRTGQGSAGAVSPDDWAIAGVGDFDGLAFTPTSTDDILWRHTATGQTFIWLMDGTTRIGQGSPGSVGNIWQIVGTGDFDGDDHADILWRHTSSGQVVIWQIMGTQRVGSGSPGQTNPADWQIVGIGDFDGDRRDDLLWRHQMTGLAFIWFIDGIDRVDAGVVGFAGLDWSVSGTGNFDGR